MAAPVPEPWLQAALQWYMSACHIPTLLRKGVQAGVLLVTLTSEGEVGQT